MPPTPDDHRPLREKTSTELEAERRFHATLRGEDGRPRGYRDRMVRPDPSRAEGPAAGRTRDLHRHRESER